MRVLAILMFLTAAAGAEPSAALKNYVACLRGQVAALDDLTSDARTIAAAAVAACRPPGPLDKGFRDYDIDAATVVVLQHRKKQR